MLKQILKAVRENEGATQAQLAERLGVSSALVGQMTDQLAATGYLQEAGTCTPTCKGCALHASCGTDHEMRLWSLTQKGYRAAKR